MGTVCDLLFTIYDSENAESGTVRDSESSAGNFQCSTFNIQFSMNEKEYTKDDNSAVSATCL